MYSTRGPSRHAIPRLPAGENRVQIVPGPETHGVAGLETLMEPMNVYCNESGRQSKRKRPLW